MQTSRSSMKTYKQQVHCIYPGNSMVKCCILRQLLLSTSKRRQTTIKPTPKRKRSMWHVKRSSPSFRIQQTAVSFLQFQFLFFSLHFFFRGTYMEVCNCFFFVSVLFCTLLFCYFQLCKYSHTLLIFVLLSLFRTTFRLSFSFLNCVNELCLYLRDS